MSDASGKNPVPEKTAEQRIEALARANEVRSARKRLKEQLRQGEADLAALVADYPSFLATARISDLVQALPRYGPAKAGKLLYACRISPSKTVAGLTARQRRELVEGLKQPSIAG